MSLNEILNYRLLLKCRMNKRFNYKAHDFLCIFIFIAFNYLI